MSAKIRRSATSASDTGSSTPSTALQVPASEASNAQVQWVMDQVEPWLRDDHQTLDAVEAALQGARGDQAARTGFGLTELSEAVTATRALHRGPSAAALFEEERNARVDPEHFAELDPLRQRVWALEERAAEVRSAYSDMGYLDGIPTPAADAQLGADPHAPHLDGLWAYTSVIRESMRELYAARLAYTRYADEHGADSWIPSPTEDLGDRERAFVEEVHWATSANRSD